MAAMVIIAVSGYHIFRKQNVDFFKRSFVMASVVGLIASVLVFLGGHTMGQFMFENQPMKFSAIEAHWETSATCRFLIITIGDLTGKREVWSFRTSQIGIPGVLSFLACNNFDCEVKGVYEIQAEYEALYGPGDYIPLMVVTYWTFRIMMTFGFIMIGVTAFFLWTNMRGDITKAKWMKWMPSILILPYLANASGWILTEMGANPGSFRACSKWRMRSLRISPQLTCSFH